MLVAGAAADISQGCDRLSDGLTLTPPVLGMAPGAISSAVLEPAGGDARITRAVIWHDSAVGSAGLQLSIDATTGNTTRVLRATPIGSGALGGADQAAIGPVSTGFDFADAPLQRLSYALRCVGPDPCAGGPGAARLRLLGANLTIDDPTYPDVHLDGLPRPGAAVRGTLNLVLSAADAGSGVRRARLTADDHELLAAETACDARQIRPCGPRIDRSLAVDTTAFADGMHNLSVRAEDGAGNVSQYVAGSVRVSNAQDPRSRPFNTRPPTVSVSGAAVRPGELLTASPGEWTPVNLYFRYDWAQCTSADACTPVVGAQSPAYVLGPDDVGKRLVVTVRAFNSSTGEQGDPATATTPIVQPAALRNRMPPDVSGTLAPGKRALANPGDWEGPAPIRFTYRWLVCKPRSCTPATPARAAATYAIRAADRQRSLAVEVTARAASGDPVTIRSAPVGPVLPAAAHRRVLPRPFIRPLVVATVVGGDTHYRLRQVSVRALRRGSTVDITCAGPCTDFAVRRRAQSTQLTLRVSPSPQLLPGAELIVRVRQRGHVGRIRRVILGRAKFRFSAMRCLAAGTDREISCARR